VRDPNGLVTQWSYDGLGREVREVRPDGTETTYTLLQAEKGKVTVTVKTTGAGEATTELDPIGRVVRTWSPGVATENNPNPPRILGETIYDALGEHVARVLAPTAENSPLKDRRYDDFYRDTSGRVVVHTSPWGGKTVTEYDGAATRITDPLGHGTVAELNARGQPAKVTDARQKDTVYGYGPFGALWSVTEPGGPRRPLRSGTRLGGCASR
jgi:YD repeat-containing protein